VHVGLILLAVVIVWRDGAPPPARPPVAVTFEAPAYQPVLPDAPEQTPELDAAAPIEAITDVHSPAAEVDPLESLRSAEDFEAPRLPPPAPPPPPPSAQTPPDRDVRFSGLGASEAREIVYVVDASGSMLTTFPNVVAELRRSIQALHPMQRFAVLLFRAFPGASGPAYIRPDYPPGVNAPVLVDATREAKRAVFRWLANVNPGGRSNPIDAIETALRLRPDAIFVLSSGATDPALLGMTPDELMARLETLNPGSPEARPVTIKTIQLLDRDPMELMRRIGRAHGGEDGYRFIASPSFDAPEQEPRRRQ